MAVLCIHRKKTLVPREEIFTAPEQETNSLDEKIKSISPPAPRTPQAAVFVTQTKNDRQIPR